MSEPDDLGRLVSELARRHHQALERNAEQVEASEQRFVDSLDEEARRSREQGPNRKFLFFGVGMAALGAAMAAGVAVGVVPMVGRGGPSSGKLDIASEMPLGGSSAPGASSSARAATDPCARSVRAAGTDPMIDDFEDGDSLISPREGRSAAWMLFKDNEPPGGLPLLTPVVRVPSTARNRRALHLVGGELRDWGASIQFDFRPSCYDASAYDGIAFTAKGPGRLYVGVREMRIVPTQWGGTCTEHCYEAHQKKLDLGTSWHAYRVPWSEFRQRGYDAPQLDPTRIHDIAFLVQPTDTPFDFWIDDVSFLVRP